MRFLTNLWWVSVVILMMAGAIVAGAYILKGIIYVLVYYVYPTLGVPGVVGSILVLLIFVIAAIATMDETSEF